MERHLRLVKTRDGMPNGYTTRPSTRPERAEVTLLGTRESLTYVTGALAALDVLDARTLPRALRPLLYGAVKALRALEADLMARAYNLENPPLPGLPGRSARVRGKVHD